MFGAVAKHELLLVLLEELHAALNIYKKTVDFADISDINFSRLALLGNEVGGRNQVDAITKRTLFCDFSKKFGSRFC